MASRPSPDAPQKQWDAWWTRELRRENRSVDLSMAPIEAKAETGPGLFALQGYPMLSSLSRRPEKLIAEAEAMFHSNVWVAACERSIVPRFAGVEYHLEDDAEETIEAGTSTLGDSLLTVLNRPSSRHTRRQLWSITARHMGLTGNAFWYLSKRELLGNTPLECLYINPARMTPVEDAGGMLLGWIMDHPQNPMTPQGVNPTPFELGEILHFVLDEPDWGHYGIGIVETAQAKIELARLTDRHASQVVASGGRLAGIISPKDGAKISDDGWQAIVRDYRNIVSDPDSAKRLQVIRSPMDFQQTSADPTEMQLVDLSALTRDDILAAWQVPQSQLGIIPSRGLNAGDTPKFEEAQLWQGPIAARLDPFVEKIQTELIDRWADLGLNAHIEVQTPEFDDQTPLFDMAEKASRVPMTVNERRALIGDDPLDEAEYGPLGAAIYISSQMVRIDDASGSPTPVSPAPLPAVSQNVLTQSEELIKASALETLRKRVEVTWEPKIRAKIIEVLNAQKDEVSGRVFAKHSHLVAKPTDTAMWWNSDKERQRLAHALEPTVLAMAREVARRAEDKVPRDLRPSKATPDAGYIDALSAFIRTRVGERVVGISETTRDAISAVIQDGISQGLGPIDLSKTIQDATAFDASRSELISRTETMFAYNDAALRTYSELGASMVQAIDGDQDEECAARDGREYSVEEAYSITDHPNGTLDWIPIVPQKAELPMTPAVWSGIEAIAKAASIPAPAPIVNVAAPPPLPAPIVNVDTSSFAVALTELKADLARPRTKTLVRDEAGRITGVIES